MLDRRVFSQIDWVLIGSALALALMGVAMIYSTEGAAHLAWGKTLYFKQLLWIIFGLLGLLIAMTTSWTTIARFSYALYGFNLGCLLLVALIGKRGMGAQRWISLGPLSFQPSELMKIALILALAKYLSNRGEEIKRPSEALFPALFVLVPTLFIMKQPDLGTAIVLLLTALGMVLLFGLPLKYLLYPAATGLLAFPFLWGLLRGYQKQRIWGFLHPQNDPLGAGYHIIQSQIAVGSGKLLGKGWMAASQSQLNFLPEHHTDFIFAVSAEQLGFLGCLLILLLYILVMSRGFLIARQGRDLFSTLLAGGIVIMIFLQVVVNVGMVAGLMPVVGIPLPLMSYGGTSMLTTMISIGLLLNIRMQSYLY
jgi:rod shape determining protein RodA